MIVGFRQWFSFASPSAIARAGILGMNRRNADFILPGNPRAHYPGVDDKLLTKRICERHGIPIPREVLEPDPDAAADAASRLGFPVALKASGLALQHSGQALVAAELALELGVKDIDGRRPAPLTLDRV